MKETHTFKKRYNPFIHFLQRFCY